MRKDIKERVMSSMMSAAQYADKVVDGAARSKEEVTDCVHRYVCAKFMLDPSESAEEALYILAEKSIAKAIASGIKVTKEAEGAPNCGTAGTVSVKLALLLMALRKDFHADLPYRDLGMARHTKDIGELVYEYYK